MTVRTARETLKLSLGTAAVAVWVLPAGAVTITPSTVSVGSNNLGAGTVSLTGPTVSGQSFSSIHDLQSTTTNLLSSEVVTPPTETSSGLRYLYSTPQTTTSWLQDSWTVDLLEMAVQSTGTNASGGKWISLSGSVSAADAVSIRFSMEAAGTFSAISTPFGVTAPLLASFFFGPSAVSSVPGATTNTDLTTLTYSANTFSSAFSSMSFNLTPGVAQPFVAYVYAGQDVTINSFELSGATSNYGLVTTPQSSVVTGSRVLIGAEQIAPIPEAEPALILAAGLGAVAALSRRRRRAGPGPLAATA